MEPTEEINKVKYIELIESDKPYYRLSIGEAAGFLGLEVKCATSEEAMRVFDLMLEKYGGRIKPLAMPKAPPF